MSFRPGKRKHDGELPPGPRTLEEVLAVFDRPIELLRSMEQELVAPLLQALHEGVILTESYAGTGAVGTCIAELFEKLKASWPDALEGVPAPIVSTSVLT